MFDLDSNNSGLLLVITGPPASGKDTVMRELLKDESLGLRRIVTYATREIRSGETEGVDHYFVTDEHFRKVKDSGNLIEHVRTGTSWKGTPKEPFLNIIHQNHRCVWRIDPFRSAKTKSLFLKHFGKVTGQLLYNKTITIYINVDDKETLKNRWFSRKADEDINQFEIRFKKDLKIFNQLKHKYDYIVDNGGKIEDTINEVKKIIARHTK